MIDDIIIGGGWVFGKRRSLTFANSSVWVKYQKYQALDSQTFQLEQFSVESAALVQDRREVSNVVMGVDGKMIVGTIQTPKVVNVGLLASSPSIDKFEDILSDQANTGKAYPITILVNSIALGKDYLFTGGAITSVSDIGSASKTWGDRQYSFVFQSVMTFPFSRSLWGKNIVSKYKPRWLST